MEDDELNHIHLQERKSAIGDRRWRAYTAQPNDYNGFGETPEAALADFIRANN